MRGRRVKEPEEVTFSVTAGDIDGVIVTKERESGNGPGGGGSGAVTQPLQIPVAVLDKGKIVSKFADVSPCLMARDYKGFSKKAEAVAVIEERKET